MKFFSKQKPLSGGVKVRVPFYGKAIRMIALLFLLPFLSQAQDLDDFKAAASNDGVKSIPYEGMRRTAGELQGEKDRAFSACEGYKGGQLHDSKKNSLRIQKEMTEDLEDAKEAVANDKGESSSTTSSLKAKVKKLEEELKDVTEEIEEMDEKIDEGLKRWQALLDKLLEIDGHYADVKKNIIPIEVESKQAYR